ncbi:hypothetical protein [Thiorhodovibrio frisius]|uniref:DUF4340 domain-containing protein n=1 Tax=Thiorhodovibrio frisius TaxID=631362 RepID=H8YZ53_9GAMM|nr:hypothetical protein [Thiorhodovibrio frisius]EIC21980.1 hypothetical protein Thi970DRAFT_02217 [Thiorhodovibrio frisius]WPL24269.1 hypothetical protein Thiofri_04486 [Thiorhodovibrio frisius]
MSGRWLINGLLLAVCTLLFLLARGQPESPPGLAGLVGLAPEAITRIRLQQQAEPPLMFQSSPEGWMMREPLQGKVTATMGERLDALLRAPATEAFKLPEAEDAAAKDATARDETTGDRASMLADLGLAAPWLELELNDLHLCAGAADPIDRRRYLLAGDAVVLIDDRWLLPLLAAPADYLIDTDPSADLLGSD